MIETSKLERPEKFGDSFPDPAPAARRATQSPAPARSQSAALTQFGNEAKKGRGEVRPGQRAKVLLKGPGGYFEIEAEGVFSGCARVEKTNHWIKREDAEPVLVPEVERFGEKHQVTGQHAGGRRASSNVSPLSGKFGVAAKTRNSRD